MDWEVIASLRERLATLEAEVKHLAQFQENIGELLVTLLLSLAAVVFLALWRKRKKK